MTAPNARYPLWHQLNEKEQGLVSRTEYSGILLKCRPTLRDNLVLSGVWAHLRRLSALSGLEEERLRYNTNGTEVVERLLDLIGTGPAWKFHCLMRSLYLTGQKSLILALELDPEVYNTDGCEETNGQYHLERQQSQPAEPDTNGSIRKRELEEYSGDDGGPSSPEAKIPRQGASNASEDRLLKAIEDHRKTYNRDLTMRNLFDLESHPNAKVIDTAKCFIEVKANTEGENREIVGIAAKNILRAFNKDISEEAVREDPPSVTQLCGPPGAGKTTFLRHFVHGWSTKSHDQEFTLMVYIRARSIKDTVTEAIEESLGCKREDNDLLMTHIEEGEGVAVVFDAIDEIRDPTVLKNVKEFIRDRRKSPEGPQILVSSRTDQCPIKSLNFERFLVLQGFTVEQGMDYVHKYFDKTMDPIHQGAINYVEKYKDKLEGILSNPLKLHVFCALTSEGILKLTDDCEFDIPSLLGILEQFLIKRECEKAGVERPSERQKQCFYRMCLFSILTGLRKFPESQLDKFCVPKCYLVFLETEIKMGENGTYITFYRFTHEVIYEYFASCYINKLSLEPLTTLLLSVCCNRSLQNVQKIMFQMIMKRQSNREELLKTMVFATLCLQNEKIESGYYIPEDIMNLWSKVKVTTDVEKMLLPCQDMERIGDINSIWEDINLDIDSHTTALAKLGWFQNLEANGTVKHIVDSLKTCTLQLQEEIIPDTLHQLMPCEFQEEDGERSVIPAGKRRWGEILNTKPIYVRTWSLNDTYEVLKTYKELHSEFQMTVVKMNINYYKYNNLWGKPSDTDWAREAWDSLLHFVSETWAMKKIGIYLPLSCPLRDLLESVADCNLRNVVIEIYYGTISLADLENCVQKCQRANLRMFLPRTSIVVPEVADEDSLRHRRDTLCMVKDSRRKEMLQDPRWIQANGKEFEWSDRYG